LSTLLEISDDMQALDELLTECGGDLSDPKTMAAFQEFADQLYADFDNKADGYAALIMEMTKRAEVRRSEAERMRKRAEIDENNAHFLKSRLMYVMTERNLKKIETDRFRISVAKNGGKLPLIIENDDQVPDYYCYQPPLKPDVNKIREALDNGEKLQFARYGERGMHLKIR